MSRQRAWGVPITVFRNHETDQVIPGPDFDKSEELDRAHRKGVRREAAPTSGSRRVRKNAS